MTRLPARRAGESCSLCQRSQRPLSLDAAAPIARRPHDSPAAATFRKPEYSHLETSLLSDRPSSAAGAAGLELAEPTRVEVPMRFTLLPIAVGILAGGCSSPSSVNDRLGDKAAS